MIESATALCITLSADCGGVVPPCDQASPGSAATAIIPHAASETNHGARVRMSALKGRIRLPTVTARAQDLVHSLLDVIQSEGHWSELNCRDLIRVGEQRPGLNECCTGRGDFSRQ
jgi:hypothetical protein